MSKKKGSDKARFTADRVRVRSNANTGSLENRNQSRKTQKEALGPDAKR